MYTLFESIDFETFLVDLKEIIQKILENIDFTQNNLMKVECFKCLSIIGKNIKFLNEDIINIYYNKEIIQILQDADKEKTQNVQISANNALKEWLEIKKICEKSEENTIEIMQSKSLTKLNIIKNLSKLAKCSTPEMERNEIYSKGINYFYRKV